MRKSNKDILLALVGTMTDDECKEMYYLVTNIRNKMDFIHDRVELTAGQYDKLIWFWGKEKTDTCISILNEWLIRKGDKITKKISHYKQLIGWVERKYYQTHPPDDKSLRFNGTIDTKWKAIKYIKKIPKELRAYDSEVRFLVEKYGIDVLVI